jgi:hypothetical protein
MLTMAPPDGATTVVAPPAPAELTDAERRQVLYRFFEEMHQRAERGNQPDPDELYARIVAVVDAVRGAPGHRSEPTPGQLRDAREAIECLGALNADEDPDEVLRVVTEVVEEVRQEHYEREQRTIRGRLNATGCR